MQVDMADRARDASRSPEVTVTEPTEPVTTKPCRTTWRVSSSQNLLDISVYTESGVGACGSSDLMVGSGVDGCINSILQRH